MTLRVLTCFGLGQALEIHINCDAFGVCYSLFLRKKPVSFLRKKNRRLECFSKSLGVLLSSYAEITTPRIKNKSFTNRTTSCRMETTMDLV